MKTEKLSDVVEEQISTPPVKGKLAKLAKMKPKTPEVPVHADPRQELGRLVKVHQAMTMRSVAFTASVSDRTNRGTGEEIPTLVPEDLQLETKAVAAAFKRRADQLESSMRRQLKKLPIYTEFLEKVFGCGPIVAAYLIAMVDFDKAIKPSNLKRFCGMAVIDGALERPTRGQKLAYCAELRTRLYQMFSAMWKNAAKLNKQTKYLTIWTDYKCRMQHSERTVDGKTTKSNGKIVSAKGFAHSGGWHKAADVFLEDFYTVGRTLAGLPVWPSYHAAKLGYSHGGKICVNAPVLLTLERALEIVGNVAGEVVPQAAE